MANLNDDGDPTKKGNVSGPGAFKKVNIPAKPATPFMTQHTDGTFRQWGEEPTKIDPAPVRKIPLHPTRIAGDVQEVDDETVNHLKKSEPNYNSLVGEPVADKNGTHRYGPEQSDNIRNLLKTYPKQATK